jgi:hypothetical protein
MKTKTHLLGLLVSLVFLFFIGQTRAQTPETVLAGKAVTFSVTAADGTLPLTYQWLKDGQPIVGATGTIAARPTDAAPVAQLVIANVTESASGSYACRVTNEFGTATSDAITIKVGVPPGGLKIKVTSTVTTTTTLTVSGGTVATAAKAKAGLGL